MIDMGMTQKNSLGILAFFYGQFASITAFAYIVVRMIIYLYKYGDVFVFFAFYAGMEHCFLIFSMMSIGTKVDDFRFPKNQNELAIPKYYKLVVC